MVEKRLKSVNTGLLMTIVILGMGIFFNICLWPDR